MTPREKWLAYCLLATLTAQCLTLGGVWLQQKAIWHYQAAVENYTQALDSYRKTLLLTQQAAAAAGCEHAIAAHREEDAP